MYVSQPNNNALHGWHFATRGDYVAFVQGDWYQRVDLATELNEALSGSNRSGDLDLDALIRFLRDKLNGVFSGFVLDTKSGDFHSFADRYGFARVFSARTQNTTILSSSLWPVRGCEELPQTPNVEAVHDTLMYGFPLLGDTVYQHIRLPRPGMILSNVGGQQSETKYFDFRRKPDSRPLNKILDDFKSICREHVASMQEMDASFRPGLALSGGKDSRVGLIGLLECGVEPTCFVGYSGSRCWDSERGEKVGRVANCETHVVDYSKQFDTDFDDSNVLIDGARTGLWTMNLARAARHQGCSSIYFGTTGDVLSGGWTANPRSFPSLDALSDFTLADYIEYETTSTQFAQMFVGCSHDDLRQRFRSGFMDDLSDDLCDVAFAFRIMSRNFHRIRTFMSGSLLHLTPIHFFHDTRVSDFYWSLPFKQLVAQRTHSALCAMHTELGKIPATSFPFGVKFEPMLVPLMQTLMPEVLKKQLRKLVHGKPTNVGKRPVNASEADKLVSAADTLGLRADAIRDFISRELDPRLVEQRVMIINTQLNPEELLERSTLIGPKQLVPMQRQA